MATIQTASMSLAVQGARVQTVSMQLTEPAKPPAKVQTASMSLVEVPSPQNYVALGGVWTGLDSIAYCQGGGWA